MEPAGRSNRRFVAALLAVILASLALVSLLAILLRRASDKSHKAETQALILALDAACKNYKRDWRVYPPGDNTASWPLHKYLGTSVPGRHGFPPHPPYFAFARKHLRLPPWRLDCRPDPPVSVIDSYGNDVRYRVDAHPFSEQIGSRGFTIWSPGPDGLDDVPGQSDPDDIRN